MRELVFFTQVHSLLGCFHPEEVEEKLHLVKMEYLGQGRHPPCAVPWLIPQLWLLSEPQGQGPRQLPESTPNEVAPASAQHGLVVEQWV